MNSLAGIFLLKTVFLTGAAVLVIEVAAVRALSPYFGSSLYVFSSILTIILAALSVGYYLGGHFADRRPVHQPLYGIITVSGLLVLTAQFLLERTLPFASSIFSVLTGPLVFGFLFFFAPAFLLGTVSPYLVKLLSLSRSPDHIGSTAGTVFFWGTLGSISGSLLTGFVLIPFFGIRHSMVGTGMLLVLLGMGGLLFLEWLQVKHSITASIRKYTFFLLFVITVTVLLVGLIYKWEPPFPYTVLYRSDGVYGHIVIYEAEHMGQKVRALKRDINNESIVSLESTRLLYEYTQFAQWYDTLLPGAQRYLMIGGGAYSVPRTLLKEDPDLEVHVVEIEPDLYPLAERFFDLQPSSRLTNHIVDGRVFLNTNEEPFDVIFMDAFGTDLTLPHHLATQEYFQTLKESLTENGVLILNYIGYLGQESPSLTGSLTKTLASVFPTMEMYAIYGDTSDVLQNIMFVARNGTKPIDLNEKVVMSRTNNPLPVSHMHIPHERYLTAEELTLTDDRAPIEYLMFSQYH